MKVKMHVLILLSFVLMIVGCSFNEPDPPSWDTSWKIYLPVKSMTLEKVVNDSNLVADTTNGQPIVRFKISDSTEWESVKKEDLSIESIQDSFSTKIGSIKLKEKSELNSPPITLSELLPPDLLAGDTIPPYPDRDVTVQPKEVAYDFYTRAKIETGQIYLTFHNDLFLTVKAGMTIEIFNNGSDTPVKIADIVFDKPITPFSVVTSEVVDLSGKEISNKFLLKYTIPIQGSDTTTVITDEMRNGTCYSVLTIENIEVSEADAEIPDQNFSKDQSIALPQDEHKIVNATISEGTILLNFKNNLSLHTHLYIELPNLQKFGEPKTLTFDLPPKSEIPKLIDLKDYQILNPDNANEPIDSLKIHIDATVGSGDSIVTVTKNDGVDVRVTTSKIYFQHIEGIINPIQQEITPTEIDLKDMFKNISGTGLHLDDLVLTLDFENQINIPITANLQIKAIHEDGGASESKTMNINASINPSGVSPTTQVVLDKNYSNPNSIVDLIAILPTKIKISGNVSIEGRGSVDVGDSVRTKLFVESPLAYRVTDSLTFKSDLDSIKKEDIDSDLRKRLSQDVAEATLHLLINNETPIGAAIKLILADDSLQVGSEAITDSSKKIVINAGIEGGEVDQNGYVISPAKSEVVIKLTKQQFQLFKESPIYLQQFITLLPTGDKKVTIRTSDKIELDAYVGIKFTVHLD